MSDGVYVLDMKMLHGVRTVTVDPKKFGSAGRLADRLARHWAEAFADHESLTYVRGYATSLRDLLTYIASLRSPPEDLRFLDDVVLDGWVDDMRTRIGRASVRMRATHIRVLLDNVDVDDLHHSLTDGTHLRWRPIVERENAPLSALSPGQWAALCKFAKREVLKTTQRVRADRALAATGGDPGDDPAAWLRQENVYWLALNGRLDIERFAAALYRRRRPGWLASFEPRALRGERAVGYIADRIGERFVPTLFDMVAFWAAMAITTGLPPESVSDLEIDWFDTPLGGDLTLLRYRKQRHGGPTTPLVLLARPQFSAQRLRDIYVELSEPLRALAPDGAERRLWIYAKFNRHHEIEVHAPEADSRHFPKWLRSVGLIDGSVVAAVDEQRARHAGVGAGRATSRAVSRLRHLEPWTGLVDPRRIRKTVKARRLVTLGVAATATDHTVKVLIAHYTNSDLIRVRSAMIINAVADTLTAFAGGPRPAVVIPDDIVSAARAAGYTGLAQMLGLAESRVEALLAGDHTVGSVACVDPCASPHDEPGRFCRYAGTELCLSCSNAVVLSDHAAALWGEIERLDRIAATVDGDTFRALHGRHHDAALHLLVAVDAAGVDSYRQRGVIPSVATGSAPLRLQRRRARR